MSSASIQLVSPFRVTTPISCSIRHSGRRPTVRFAFYQQKGHPVPSGWVLDFEGQPTTDPNAAFEGLIQSIGGHKGVGLGMAIGMLSTLLSGSSYGTELGDLISRRHSGRDGHFCLAINIAAFQPLDLVRSRVDRIVEQIRGGRRLAGVDRLYAPGDLGDSLDRDYSAHGIPFNRETLSGVQSAAQMAGASIAEFDSVFAGEAPAASGASNDN